MSTTDSNSSPERYENEPTSKIDEESQLNSLLANGDNQNTSLDSDEEEDIPAAEMQAFLENHSEVEDELEQEETITFTFPSFLSLVLFSAYFLGVSSAIIVILVVDHGKTCDQPLQIWAIVQLAILTVGLLVRIWTTINQYRRVELENQLCWRIQSKTGLFLEKIINMFWSVWFLIGMVWTFNTNDCNETAPALYILSLTIISINLFLIGMCILCFVCAFVCFGIIYIVNPRIFGQQANRGAPKKVIDKLETKSYKEGLFDDEGDAKCAICLCTYEVADELRFLPCKPKNHHFHRECVDEWLKLNKACPFCKRSIDQEDDMSETAIEGDINNV